MKSKGLPATITAQLTDRDVLASINDLFLVGYPTTTSCLGACAIRRTIYDLFPHSTTHVGYGQDEVTIYPHGRSTRYYRKDSAGRAIDRTYDAVYEDVKSTFGSPVSWSAKESNIREFAQTRLAPLVGIEFTLSKRSPKGLGAHSHNSEGKATGGNVKKRTCITRNQRLRQVAGDAAGI